ncbi:MAG: hypothetical protein ACRDR6_09275 [Pseudonocardiaceae bacterium]
MTDLTTHLVPARLLAQGLAVTALTGIALVHLVQLPDAWRQMPGLAALFTLLIIASAAVASLLLHTDHRRLWRAAALIAVGSIGGYLLTRGVAVPFDRDDVGNWLEPLGLVALFIEASLLALCGYTLRTLPTDTA